MTCTIGGIPVFSGRVKFTPPYWEDLRVPVTATTRGGANDPTFAQLVNDGGTSQGVYAQNFSAVVEQELFFWVQMPHAWFEGSAIRPHVHWCPTTAAAGGVVWGLEYTIAKIGAVFPNTTIINAIDATSSTALQHELAGFGDLSMTGNTISTQIGCRIFRNVAHASDTYAAAAALLEIDFHYQVDAPGSRQETSK